VGVVTIVDVITSQAARVKAVQGGSGLKGPCGVSRRAGDAAAYVVARRVQA
jgi:hypothetical protein